MDYRIAHILREAFALAHLLTADTEQAESAILEATDCSNPCNGDGEDWFRRVLQFAVRRGRARRDPDSDDTGSCSGVLPAELRNVLKLQAPMRVCYVLRILAGLSRRTCGELLEIGVSEVDEYTSAAMQALCGVREPAGELVL